MTFVVQQTLLFAIPLMIVALAGVFAERSGIINLALEGIMIMGAFIGVYFVRLMQGLDVFTDAARAGILHDITKAIDGPLQLTLCEAYGKILSDFSRRYPKTLHALTGSLVAQRIFGENDAVVSAIEHHTTGKADMNLLEKIIYVADYMEPNRNFPGVEKLRELAFSDIDAALKLGLEMTLEHLKRQGNEVSPASRDALAWLNR